ncbi:unnamed protein product, partial [Cyprideis torosa]
QYDPPFLENRGDTTVNRTYHRSISEFLQVWEGFNVVKMARGMMGETNPSNSKPGTIRGDFCLQTGRNVIHGSDSVESANREIGLWFKADELQTWTRVSDPWVYED